MDGSLNILGVPAWRWAAAFGVVLAYFVAVRIIRFVLSRPARRIEGRANVEAFRLFLDALPGPMRIGLAAPAAWAVGQMLKAPPHVEDWLALVSNWLIALSVAYFAYSNVAVLEHYLLRLARRTESKLDDMLVPMIRRTVKVLIIIFFGTYVAEAIAGKPITTILTGLGLGGLAFALAAQDTIKNMFGSLMILADKPFMVGDWVVIDGVEGVVEDLGFRSTRIRTFPGELVTMPNEKVASAQITNVSRRPFIRMKIKFGLTYDTPPERLERAVELIHEILDREPSFPKDRPPKVFFTDYGPDYLELTVNIWYTPPDYWASVAYRHRFNLAVLKAFNEEGLEFAFPTRTLYLASDPGRELKAEVIKRAESAKR